MPQSAEHRAKIANAMRQYHTTCGGRKKTTTTAKPKFKVKKDAPKKVVKVKKPVAKKEEMPVMPKKVRKPRAKKAEMSKQEEMPKPKRTRKPRAQKVKEMPVEVSAPVKKAPAKKKPVRPSYPPPPPPKKKATKPTSAPPVPPKKEFRKQRPFLKDISKGVEQRRKRIAHKANQAAITSHPEYRSFEQLQANIKARERAKVLKGQMKKPSGRKRGGQMNPFQPTGNITYSTMRSKL